MKSIRSCTQLLLYNRIKIKILYILEVCCDRWNWGIGPFDKCDLRKFDIRKVAANSSKLRKVYFSFR